MVPKIKEFKDVQETQDFAGVTGGFQKAVLTQKAKHCGSLTGEDQEMKLPVVGYTGHRPAYKAQGFYGKNFRDCAIQSKFTEKMLK